MVFGVGLFYNALWTYIVARTQNLFFDALLYDICIAVFYCAFIIYAGGYTLNWGNGIGVLLAITGLTLVHLFSV